MIDGQIWAGSDTATKNWRWTLTGGDCDNILPHPTFAVYAGPDSTTDARLSSDAPTTTLGALGNQHGFLIGPAANVGPTISPAFALSGDYLVKGEWDGKDGKHRECTVKVAVRAPGVRVELCWAPLPNDLDLHVARLAGGTATCANGHGWFDTCKSDLTGDDCYYDNCATSTTDPSPWGYPKSATTACHGWGSRRAAGAECDNPRLDLDNVSCDPKIPVPGTAFLGLDSNFCGPENINIDAPRNGERFAVGVHFYARYTGQQAAADAVKPHVNIYCNGERKLAFGYDPLTTPVADFPHLITGGTIFAGGPEFWSVATVTAVTDGSGKLVDCAIAPIKSKVADTTHDGSIAMCVDQNVKRFMTATGNYPAATDALCLH